VALRVSDVANKTGVSADTIRFYERKGLLPPPQRTPSGYRQYRPSVVERVRFIKGAQSLELSLSEIRELLEIKDRGACPCGHTKAIVEQHIAEIDDEVRKLRRLRSELESLRTLEWFDLGRSSAGSWPCGAEFVKRGGG
jgi:DNA-binding transcriptional MerR regulator